MPPVLTGGEEDDEDVDLGGVLLLLLELDDVGPDVEDAGGAEPAPAGAVVGRVLGMPAVFQVAVVGQAVVATVGEVVP